MPQLTKSLAKQERLITALNAYQAARRVCEGAVFTAEQARAECRAESALEDAAVECGMDRSEGDLEGWAAAATARFLMAA